MPCLAPPTRAAETLSAVSFTTEPDLGLPLGDFELLSEVGRGSMGVVFKARQKSLDGPVAVKVLLGAAADNPALRARFLNEARAAATLNHPGIVKVYEVGEGPTGLYYAMEFIDGRTLEEHLRRGPLQFPTAASLLVSLANAVHYAHRRGVVHRDLKPSNIMIARGRRPVVMDFGLAKFMDQPSALTRPGVLVGTPAFMAPEQARNEHDRMGPRTDVYALGGILYNVLTGRPPYQGGSALGTALMVLGPDMPAPVRKFSPEVPAELEAVCMRCLEKRPEDRYPSARALAKAVLAFTDRGSRPCGAVLVVERTGQQVRLTREATLVGRGGGCRIRIRSQAVSRRHCQLFLRDGRVWVEDLGSRNGTSVNGRPVERAELRVGDRLGVAGHIFHIAVVATSA